MRTLTIIDAADFNQVASNQVNFRLYKNAWATGWTMTGKSYDAMLAEARNIIRNIAFNTDGVLVADDNGDYRDASGNMVIAANDDNTTWTILHDIYTIEAEIEEKDVYVIVDNSANSGKTYIGDGNSNVEILENAIQFDNELEADNYIEEHNWEDWASISCETIDA